MKRLNLPHADLRIREAEGIHYVFDIIRKKEVILTPEEWVRQHFLHLLVHHLHYPKSMINLEAGLTYFKSAKRSDILVYDRLGNPFLIVECKEPDTSINMEAVNQVSVYNKIVTASYLAVTNGLKHFIWKQEGDHYTQLESFPPYPV
jgi:hypothetical protein